MYYVFPAPLPSGELPTVAPGGGSRLGAASVDRLCCPERKGVPCCLRCPLAPSCRRAAYCPPGGGIGSNRSILLPYYYFRPCSLSPAIWGAAYYPRRWFLSGCCSPWIVSAVLKGKVLLLVKLCPIVWRVFRFVTPPLSLLSIKGY